jgi:hypothetical protein
VLRVLQVGSVNNTFGVKGVQEYCQFFKSIEDANALRRRISECFERAALPYVSASAAAAAAAAEAAAAVELLCKRGLAAVLWCRQWQHGLAYSGSVACITSASHACT